MNAHQRAARLFEEAEKLGCDTPTESMVAQAINDAESDAHTEIIFWVEQLGHEKLARYLTAKLTERHSDI